MTAPMPPELLATVDVAKRDHPGPHDTPKLLQARLHDLRRRLPAHEDRIAAGANLLPAHTATPKEHAMACSCSCLDCREGRHGGCQYGCR